MDISDLTKAVRNHALKDAYAKAYEAGRELTTDEEIERHAQGIVEAFRKGAEKTRREDLRKVATEDIGNILRGLDAADVRPVLKDAIGEGIAWGDTPEGCTFWDKLHDLLIEG